MALSINNLYNRACARGPLGGRGRGGKRLGLVGPGGGPTGFLDGFACAFGVGLELGALDPSVFFFGARLLAAGFAGFEVVDAFAGAFVVEVAASHSRMELKWSANTRNNNDPQTTTTRLLGLLVKSILGQFDWIILVFQYYRDD